MVSILAGMRVKHTIIIGIAFAMVLAGIVLALPTLRASAAEGDSAQVTEAKLDCLSCHTRGLVSHDRFGTGSQACWTCHDGRDIGTLVLLDGTQIKMSQAPELCGQCHAGKKNLWDQRKHGVASTDENGNQIENGYKLICTACHNPHNPKIDVADFINLPPEEIDNPDVLRCSTCHRKVLVGHDVLGQGNAACRACHSATLMGELHLAGQEGGLSMRDAPQLCGQCHQDRYQEWQEGSHGAPAWKENEVVVHGEGKVSCIGCHDPHQPQITLTGITIPHPDPVPEPPKPEFNPLMILGIAVLTTAGIGVVVATRGGGL